MASTFKRLGIDLLATGGTDVRVKVSIGDTNSGFLDGKIALPASGKITKTIGTPFGNETLILDVDDTNIDHDALANFTVTEHRLQDDAQTTTTTLWSSQKTQDVLDNKINKVPVVADNRLLKSVGITGVDVEQTAITVDDSGNVTGMQDLTLSGNLTVNGTTTTVNSATLSVTDANIDINVSGTQAAATLATAGLTITMTDALDAVIGYDSTLTSKFKLGVSGDLREVLTTTHIQGITNKTIDIDSNTLSNVELDNFKASAIDLDDTLSTADDTKVPTSLTVKSYVDNSVTAAVDVTYNNTISGLTATNVKIALDELSSEKLDIPAFSAAFDVDLALKDTDDLAEGITNLYFTNTRAKIASVVNSTAGVEIDQAPSVAAMKSYVTGSSPSGALSKSQGDIDETSFTATSGATNANVTGLSFNASTQSVSALVSVYRDATVDLYEVFDMLMIFTGAGWTIAYSELGNATGITFDIDATGQVTYSDIATPAGHVSTTINFRAVTTTN